MLYYLQGLYEYEECVTGVVMSRDEQAVCAPPKCESWLI